MVIAFELGNDAPCFGASEDDGEFGWPADALDPGDGCEFSVEDFLIEKEECAEGLVLSGSGDAAVDGEVAEKGGDLLFAHVGRMAFSVEENVAADPIDISFFGADAVVLDAQVPADAVEEFVRT